MTGENLHAAAQPLLRGIYNGSDIGSSEVRIVLQNKDYYVFLAAF